MLYGIGYAVPFSFLGFVLSFVAFNVTLLVIMGICQILKAQKILW